MEITTKSYNFTIKPRTCLSTDKFDFFIDVSNDCDAGCLFCCNDNESDKELDLKQLETDFLKVKDRVARVVISGGEPLIDPERLGDLLKLLSSFEVDVKLITNGHKLEERLPILGMYGVRAVQLSRHHYHDSENDGIFSTKTLQFEKFGGMVENHPNIRFSVNCLLIQGYIDNAEKIVQFLESCSQIGIDSVKFVGLMKVNQYCHKHFVDYREVIKNLPVDFLQTDSRNDEDRCSCVTSSL